MNKNSNEMIQTEINKLNVMLSYENITEASVVLIKEEIRQQELAKN